MKLLFMIPCFLMAGTAHAENSIHSSIFPIPPEVSEIVTWTQLCEKWITLEHQNDAGLVNSIPAMTWAQSHCSYEALESQIISLQEKYKNDPMASYALDHLMGIYKD